MAINYNINSLGIYEYDDFGGQSEARWFYFSDLAGMSCSVELSGRVQYRSTAPHPPCTLWSWLWTSAFGVSDSVGDVMTSACMEFPFTPTLFADFIIPNDYHFFQCNMRRGTSCPLGTCGTWSTNQISKITVYKDVGGYATHPKWMPTQYGMRTWY